MRLNKSTGTRYAFVKIICVWFRLEHSLKNKIPTEIQVRYRGGDGETTLSHFASELL